MWENYLCCVDPEESGGFFCFFLAGRRSPLTRDAILGEHALNIYHNHTLFFHIYTPFIITRLSGTNCHTFPNAAFTISCL